MLDGIRVLDISRNVAGAFCAKLLGDLGAHVVLVEPAEGHPMRRHEPRAGDFSSEFSFFHTSKESLVLDIDADPARFKKLISQFDIVVSSDTHEGLEQRGMDYDRLSEYNAAIILCTISGFGSFGPHSGYASNHLIACAAGGWSQLCGVPGREPLQTGAQVSETLAGGYAAAAVLLAFIGRSAHGVGEHIDVSVQEAVLAGAQIPSLIYEYRDLVVERYSSVGSGAGACYMLPTETGHIGLNALTLAQWLMLCRFLDQEQVALDDYYQGLSWTTPDVRLEDVREIFRDALAGRTAEALFHEAQEHRVPFGLVPGMADLLKLQPHVERAFFKELVHSDGSCVTVPGLPFTSAPLPAAAPRRNQSGEPKTPSDVKTGKRNSPAPGSQPLPLDGLRVLDLSMFFAGPTVSQILADAGADVIKVESLQRIDGWRGSGTQMDGELPSWEASPYFNWINRNKRDVTLNLKDPRGVAAVKTLAAKADIVIENFTPRVMAEFGLDYDVLKSLKPDLLMISLSGFGANVSWRDYVAFGMSTEQMSGISTLTGYADSEPLFTGMTGGDLYSGVMGAVIVLAALHQLRRTGQGCHIDLSQIEACNLYLGDEVVAFSMTGVEPGRQGNRSRKFAPQGIYPCSDGWLAISCMDDDAWSALCETMNLPDWLTWTLSQRQANHDEIDEWISQWSQGQKKHDLWHLLQSRGVAAAAVLNGPELLQNPQRAARRFFIAQDRPGLGVKHYPGQPYRFRNAKVPPAKRAPLLGEHLVEILTQEAGLTDDEIAEMIIEDVTGVEPVAARS